MEENDLFVLDWPVDQEGYDLEFVEPPALAPGTPVTVLSEVAEVATEPYWAIKRRGGPPQYYRPLKDHPGLARRFADLAQTSGAYAAFVDFANTKEAHEIMVGLRNRRSVRIDVSAPKGQIPTADVPTFEYDADRAAAEREANLIKFDELFSAKN